MGGYGYDERPPMADRLINSPAQAQPRSAWPRRVADAVKTPPNTSFRLIQHVMHCDATVFFGPAGTASGTLSTTVTETDAGWFSEIGRFCQLIEVTNSAGAKTYRFRGVQIITSPIAWLDPDEPYVPARFRYEDVVACRMVTPSAGQTAFMHFGLTSVSGSGLTNQPRCFVGFAVSMDNSLYGNWRAVCVDGTGGSTVDGGSGLDEDLGITSELPHRLAYEIDGANKLVNYYIDGELVYTHLATGADLGTITTFEMNHRWNVGAEGGGSIKAGICIDGQSVFSVEPVDEAA